MGMADGRKDLPLLPKGQSCIAVIEKLASSNPTMERCLWDFCCCCYYHQLSSSILMTCKTIVNYGGAVVWAAGSGSEHHRFVPSAGQWFVFFFWAPKNAYILRNFSNVRNWSLGIRLYSWAWEHSSKMYCLDGRWPLSVVKQQQKTFHVHNVTFFMLLWSQWTMDVIWMWIAMACGHLVTVILFDTVMFESVRVFVVRVRESFG